MFEFDFNKLDKYKKIMQEEGIIEMKWELHTMKIYDKYILQMFSDFDDLWEIENDNWEEFKIEVANKVLSEEVEYEGDVNQDFNFTIDIIGG